MSAGGAGPMRFAAALLAFAASCGFVMPRQPKPGPEEGAWAEERARFTRSTKIYDKLDDRAFATATYQAPLLREARVLRLAVWQSLTAQERDARLAQERQEAAQFEDFIVAFYTNDRSANDLDSPRSVWRVSLSVAVEGDLLPARIEQVRLDATLHQLYPYINPFDTVYRVRFPHWQGSKPLTEQPFLLRIAGALGNVEITFDGKMPEG